MADEKNTIVVRPEDYDRKPVTITKAEVDALFDRVFGRMPATKEDRR